MDLETLVGQKLTIGVPGTRVTPEIIRHFKELHAGGIILYRINFESPAQIKKFISDLESALARKLLVCVDHEGGRVVMFRDGVTVFPDNLALGKTGKIVASLSQIKGSDTSDRVLNEEMPLPLTHKNAASLKARSDYARKQGEIEAKELRRLGVDVNLSPVLDVLTDSYSPNIGIRSYGSDWKLVSALGGARIAAMQKGGISACAKHFPGKGHAPLDAHLGLPVIPSTWEEMEAIHLRPFVKAIENGIHSVMTSHPYYPFLDPEPNRIATFSRKIVYDTLRKRLKFKGVIFSDDLEMGAIKAICPIPQAGVKAAQAGHDILLVCHDMEAQRKVYNALLEAYRNKTLSNDELEESFERIETLKAKRKKRFEGGLPHPVPAGKVLARIICDQSVTFLKNPIRRLLTEWKKRKMLVIFPRLSSLASKIMVEKELCNEEKYLRTRFKRLGLKPEIRIVEIEPSPQETLDLQSLSRDFETTLLFCFDARLYPSNQQLLDGIQIRAREAVIALLRDPYDSDLIHKNASCLTDFGWRVCQIDAILKKLFSY